MTPKLTKKHNILYLLFSTLNQDINRYRPCSAWTNTKNLTYNKDTNNNNKYSGKYD